MATNQELANHITDMLQGIGPVSNKRMFGGHGFFLDGLMLGLLAHNTLYLKVDSESIDDFEEQGLEAFAYNKNGKIVSMSYHQAPEEALENIDVMHEWGNKAFAAALRSAAKTKRR